MSHHKLREDKRCQNCGYVVRKRFCPKCGQENVETRQSFHYLFTHFIEDLVHYDGSFWKTVKYLMFKPGLLTREYLDGKRKKYVAPVKLYIFVSFFVFFIGGIISKIMTNYNENKTNISNKITLNNSESTENNIKEPFIIPKDSLQPNADNEIKTFVPKSKREYDSIQLTLPENKRDNTIERLINRKLAETGSSYTDREFWLKKFNTFKSNFSKFLFFYMPVFAFVMWLFHSKRRWYYFDHGIFTLHYFSFILLSFFVSLSVVNTVASLTKWYISFITVPINIAIYIWVFIYFFKAHRKVYGYSKIDTVLRGLFLLGINMFLFIFGIVLYFILIFLIF